MNKREIILYSILGIILIIAIYFVFFRKRNLPQNAISAGYNKSCYDIVTLVPKLHKEYPANWDKDYTDDELTDLVYPLIEYAHKAQLLMDIQLTGNMTRAEKINAFNKFMNWADRAVEACKG